LVFPAGLFSSHFPTKTLHVNHTCYFLRPSYSSWCYCPKICGEEKAYRRLSFSLCCLLQLPVTSFLLSPNIFPITLFSSSLSLCSSFSVRDQVSNSYKQQVKLYFRMF
jgi:hypothetical protein